MIPVRTSAEPDETPGAVIGLVFANVVVFFIQSAMPGDLVEAFIRHNALVPGLYTAADTVRLLDPASYLPFLTNAFMHADAVHLTVNMWALWIFGRPLEGRLGAGRFILLYLASGIAASLAHFAFNLSSMVPALGASGAIAGVLGAYTASYPRSRIVAIMPVLFFPIPFTVPAVFYTAVWFAIQVAQGVLDLVEPGRTSSIAWWAHVGGFVAGLVAVAFLGAPGHRARRIGETRARQLEVGFQRIGVLRVGPAGRQIPAVRRAASVASRNSPPRRPNSRHPDSGGPSLLARVRHAAARARSEIEAAAAEREKSAAPAKPGPWG